MRGMIALALILAFGVRAAMSVKPQPSDSDRDVPSAARAETSSADSGLPLWVRRVVRALATIGGVLAALVVLVLIFENRFIYYPTRHPGGDWDHPQPGVTDCWIETADGLKLHAWWMPGADPGRGPVMLWFHGNAGNLTHRAENLAMLKRHGPGVLIVDYRGYGKSQGHPSEKGLYLDGEAAHRHLTQELGVAPGRIVCFGRSLGCAVALHVALERPAAGLILESPFADARSMARRMLPVIPLWPFVRSDFDNIGRIPQLRVPVLVLHGSRDGIVPFQQGRAVFEAAPQPKEFYRIEGAGHNDTYLAGGEPYFAKLIDFCNGCVAGAK